MMPNRGKALEVGHKILFRVSYNFELHKQPIAEPRMRLSSAVFMENMLGHMIFWEYMIETVPDLLQLVRLLASCKL